MVGGDAGPGRAARPGWLCTPDLGNAAQGRTLRKPAIAAGPVLRGRLGAGLVFETEEHDDANGHCDRGDRARQESEHFHD